ncbi:two-component response regulator ORR21-like isoform X1 [Coffea arabica]|uniref:Two-component response regulator ORR21-like isoform X1 n=1 Tax=Coffea arabica TaxID=13443 RepID=A0A6P6V3L2_COFAR
MATACKEALPVPLPFPAGLKVLVVDDDLTCLKILEQMLTRCMYRVTTCSQATVALNLLREKKGFFDIVLSEVHVPDMDGFKLLELVSLEMNLPVIMMSVDDRTSIVVKGIMQGACDYLIKPIRFEELKNIWQHVVRKRCNKGKEHEHLGTMEDYDHRKHESDEATYAYSVSNKGADGEPETSTKKRKDAKQKDDTEIGKDDLITSKKMPVIWSIELHQQFVSAVNHLGIDKATPKKIMELMNVPGLTRENVANHLQKYRLYLTRLSAVVQKKGGLPSSFCGGIDEPNPKVGSAGRFDVQALPACGHIPQQTLAAFHPKLGQNVAYTQPSIQFPSNIPKHISQTVAADNPISGLDPWSSKNLDKMVAGDNVTGLRSQNGTSMMSTMRLQQQRQQQEPQQNLSILPKPNYSITVQPSHLVVPAHSSPSFQVVNSLVSANQNCSPGRSSIINYNIVSPQSNIPATGIGRTADAQLKSTTVLGGSSAAGSPAFSACSVDANNGVAVQVPSSALTFGPSRKLPVHVPYIPVLQNSPGMPKNTDLGGGWTSILSRFTGDEIGLPVSNVNQEMMHGENNCNDCFQKKSFLSWRKSICLHHGYICIFFVVLFFIFTTF